MKENTVLTTNNTTALANKELTKSVKKIKDAQLMERGSAWVIASEYANITESESYTEDFENLGDFASFMGVTKGLISQYKNAVEYVSRETSIYSVNDISVVKAYALSTLKEKDIDFITWCQQNDRDITCMSDAGLKATIKEWKKELEAVDVEAEETEVEEAHEAMNEPTEEEIDRAEAIHTIKTLMEQYNITIEELGL